LFNDNDVLCSFEDSFSRQELLIINHEASSFLPHVVNCCFLNFPKGVSHHSNQQVEQHKHCHQSVEEPDEVNQNLISELKAFSVKSSHHLSPRICNSSKDVVSSKQVMSCGIVSSNYKE